MSTNGWLQLRGHLLHFFPATDPRIAATIFSGFTCTKPWRQTAGAVITGEGVIQDVQKQRGVGGGEGKLG